MVYKTNKVYLILQYKYYDIVQLYRPNFGPNPW